VLNRVPPVRAVIVDLDGTMVDTLGDFQVALNGMLADLGLPETARQSVERAVGKGSEHLVRTVLAQQLRWTGIQTAADVQALQPAGEALVAQGLAHYQRHYRRINGLHAKVYPGVKEGLANLKAQGWSLACLTNKPLAFAQELLKIKGLDGFFTAVFGGDSFERKKPDPLPLIKTCEALGTLPAQTLMVGDSQNDAQAARRAGCPVVLVTYGYNHGEPVRSVDADGFVDSLAELTAQVTAWGV
jgi:phosphoglycolate phosphatase